MMFRLFTRSAFVQGLCVLSVCGGLLYVGGCSVNDSDVKTQAETFHKGIAPAVEDDPTIDPYLQQIGARIVAAAQQCDKLHIGPPSHFSDDNSWMFGPIEFHLVNSQTINAFTTGGIHVYIYEALLQRCTDENDLAAVMSHEFAHIYCRHVAAGMKRQKVQSGFVNVVTLGTQYASQKYGMGDVSSQVGSAATVATNFVGMGYTRGDEDQADEYGFQFYSRAGWDPTKFDNFFKNLIAAGFDTTPEYESDHPKLSTRVAHTEERLKQLPPEAATWAQPEIDTPDQFAAFKQQAAAIAARTPNDQSLKQAQTLLNAFPSCVAPAESPLQKQAQAMVASWTNPPAK